jgi:serine/threonine-protein kinase
VTAAVAVNTENAPRPDRLLAGRYRLERVIATGGMAQVWEATDEVLARKVAVKVLLPHLAGDEAFVARFRAEAVAAARLAHPSIVSIYDTCSDDGDEAIVMQLVRGTTLRQYLDQHGALDPPRAVAIAAQVADALDVAHRAGLVHRDIKPANILLGSDGRVMVADFGIAKAADAGDLTVTGTTLGSVKYLAPEQVTGDAVDARTDVYAVGVVLYEMLCGRAPFVADTDAATALARLHRDPMRPRQIRAGIPKPLEDIVLRAMARDPAARYASAGDLRTALRGTTAADPSPLLANDDATVATGSDVHLRTDPTGEVPRFTRTERSWLVPTVIIVIVAVGLAVAGVLFSRTDTGRSLLRKATPAAAPPAAVSITGAQAFDPLGDGSENDDEAHFATDGKADTSWTTVGYNTRTFGRLKTGVGLYVTLTDASKLATLHVTSPTKGWSASVYVAASPGESLADWGEPVDTKHGIDGDASFDLHDKSGAAVLVWITDLGDGPPRVHTELSEITVTGSA